MNNESESFHDPSAAAEGKAADQASSAVSAVAKHAQQAKVRLYDRLFVHAHPDAGGRDYKASLNSHSKKTITAYVESSLNQSRPEERFQFERHGYFIADREDTEQGKPVFNRAVTLRDSWGKIT